MMMKRLKNGVEEGAAGILSELESGSGTVLKVERLDGVVETACGADDGDRAVPEAVNLVQAAGFVARGHHEDV